MELISSYLAPCRDLDVQTFVRRVTCPFLVPRGRLTPLRVQGPTIDRLVLGREDAANPPGPGAVPVFPLRRRDPKAQAITIGSSRTCDVQINDVSVSRVHALLYTGAAGYSLSDNDSS